MSPEYITYSENPHGREEELQWARLVSNSNPVKGMVVIFLQKMCAAYHEFEPAYRAGALLETSLPHFQKRLANRIGSVLTVLRNNGLETLDGYEPLARLQQATLAAHSLNELADLAEAVHLANHAISDELEKID